MLRRELGEDALKDRSQNSTDVQQTPSPPYLDSVASNFANILPWSLYLHCLAVFMSLSPVPAAYARYPLGINPSFILSSALGTREMKHASTFGGRDAASDGWKHSQICKLYLVPGSGTRPIATTRTI